MPKKRSTQAHFLLSHTADSFLAHFPRFFLAYAEVLESFLFDFHGSSHVVH